MASNCVSHFSLPFLNSKRPWLVNNVLFLNTCCMAVQQDFFVLNVLLLHVPYPIERSEIFLCAFAYVPDPIERSEYIVPRSPTV